MKPSYLERLRLLGSPGWSPQLQGIKRGLEKESLRVNLNGEFASTPHPIGLGSSLTHPLITTDFAESQLEFITLPSEHLNAPLQSLQEIHQYTHATLQDEMLWAGSMPCHLPKESEIPIAKYGTSNIGKFKEVYRKGLAYRYGPTMQTISGVHYNFSLPQDFWQAYQQEFNLKTSLDLFVSEQYLGMVRNSLRFGWLLPLLFGASPAVLNSFFKNSKPNLVVSGSDTLIGSYATSLRLSDLGYQNKVQSEVKVSFNSLSEFVNSLQEVCRTPHPAYTKIGLKVAGEYRQLNDFIFQIENEFYSLVRPKRVTAKDERMLTAMQQRGIEYIEVRAIDLNPFEPTGIDPYMIPFLDVFLMFCLLNDSPSLTDKEQLILRKNIESVVLYGRQPKVSLIDLEEKTFSLKDFALALLSEFEAIASVLDKTYDCIDFSRAILLAKERIIDPDHLPASKMLIEMQQYQGSYFEFALAKSKEHSEYFQNLALSSTLAEAYNKLQQQSIIDQIALESASAESFDAYLKRYLKA